MVTGFRLFPSMDFHKPVRTPDCGTFLRKFISTLPVEIEFRHLRFHRPLGTALQHFRQNVKDVTFRFIWHKFGSNRAT